MSPRAFAGAAGAALAAAALLVFALRSCGGGERPPPSEVPEAAAEEGDGEEAPLACERRGAGLALGDGAERGEPIVGEAIRVPEGIVVGLLRAADGGGAVAAVARLPVAPGDRALRSVSFVELGKGVGDLPPPRPFTLGDRLFAATYASGSDGGASRSLIVSRIDGARATAVLEVPNQRDESPAFDVAGASDPSLAMLAWDEDASAGGVIKVLALRAAGSGGVARAAEASIASNGGDVEAPRIAPRGRDGFWAAWIARRIEGRSEVDAGDVERPAEDRAFSWVELVRLDGAGKPMGAVQRLTAETGRIGAFDLRAWGRDASNLELVARDEAEAHGGDGGRLFWVSVTPGGDVTGRWLVSRGAGKGELSLLGAPDGAGWALYGDSNDGARVAPLVPPRADAGVGVGWEVPAFDGLRVLGLADPAGKGVDGHHFLAIGAAPNSPAAAEAHIISCAALNR